MNEISLIDMLKAGVHFGHQQSRRHPKMEPYIFTTRGGVSILNLEKTRAALNQALTFIHDLTARGGTIILVGTKRQAKEVIQEVAQLAGMPYVTDRWIGGLFTNFANVRQLSQKLHRLKEERASGSRAKYTKKEQFEFDTEIERLEQLVGGVANMDKLPDAVFITDVRQEKNAIHEAKKMKIPVVAICDTNVNPTGIAYCIPANDDATKSLHLITSAVAEAISAGRRDGDAALAAAAKTAADSAAAATVAVEAHQE
jgi:small subunit ribosomal protein S2